MGDFRKRVLIPAALPLVAAGFVGLLAFSFSRVLLAVPEAGSTILAILMAGMILAVCGVIAASGKGLKQSQKLLAIFGGVALLGAGVAGASLGIREIAPHAEEIPIVAADIAFSTTDVIVPADQPVAIAFENRDPNTPHDVDIFADDAFTPPPLFDGAVVTGVATQIYDVPPLAAGEYVFRCSIHVQMTGTIKAEEGAGGHGATDGPTTQVLAETEITAAQIAFDTELLELKADVPTTITLINADTAPHDLQIYPDATFTGEALFDGENADPGKTQEYKLNPIPAGEYAFRCSIHPQMNGTARFVT